MDVISEIKRVLQTEIDALVALSHSVDESFTDAINLLFSCSGKVVVIGMGKSGLIGQKIAATMASTGTPAIFMHAGDGLHGDVGIVQRGDTILAISKSGETDELLQLGSYFSHNNNKIILITADSNSSLAKSADLVLFTPIDQEACPLNLAPTSSTTSALAIGDALAMVLMAKRGFTADDFGSLHQGGQLGKRLLLTVGDVMRKGNANPVVPVSVSTLEMLHEMSEKGCGAVSVVDINGGFLGLITDYDVRKTLEFGFDISLIKVSQMLNPEPTTVTADAKAVTALHIMENRSKPTSVLPVVDKVSNHVVGMLHIHDLVAEGL